MRSKQNEEPRFVSRGKIRAALSRVPRRMVFRVCYLWLHRGLDKLCDLPGLRWWRARLHRWVEYSSTDILLERGQPGLHGLRIAFLSDLHAGFFTTAGDLERLGERLSVLAPDAVCFGGDMISTRMEEVAAIGPLLARIDPPLGVFAVPGNHEHACLNGEAGGPGLVHWQEQLADMGVTPLMNRGVRLEREGAGFWLCGVEDDNEGRVDLAAALAGHAAEEPVVLLSHTPDVFIRSMARGIDLQISGHTHGGQVRILGWAPVNNSREGFLAGRYQRAGSQLYVGRGVGTSLFPIRLGAQPEVPMLRLLLAP